MTQLRPLHVAGCLLLLLVLSAGAWVGLASADPALDSFRQGLDAMDMGDWPGAELAFDLATKQDPKFEVAYYFLGLASVRTGRMDAAEAAFKKAVELVPQRSESRLLLAKIYLGRNEYQVAADLLRQELDTRLPAATAEVRNLLGLAYRALGDNRRAQDEFRVALSVEKNFLEARLNLGQTLHTIGQSKDALDQYNQCTRAIDDWRAAERQAMTQMAQGRRDPEHTEEKVFEQYRRVRDFVRVQGSWPELNLARGDAYMALKDYALARQAYRDVLSPPKLGNRFDVRALSRIGTSYYQEALAQVNRGQTTNAMRLFGTAASQFQRVLDVNPEYGPPYDGLAQVYLSECVTFADVPRPGFTPHTAAEAAEQAEAAVDAEPDNTLFLLHLGQALYEDKRYAEASDAFTRSVAAAQARGDRDSASEASAYLGRSLLAEKKNDQALQAAQKAVEFLPNSIVALLALGDINYALGNYGAATDALSKVVEKNPDDVQARSSLGQSLLAQASWTRARLEFEKALKGIPISSAWKLSGIRAQLLLRIGYCLVQEKYYDRAIRTLNDSLSVDPSSYAAEIELAHAYQATGRFYAAISALQIAIDLSPSAAQDSSIYYDLGALYERLGLAHDAFVAYERAVEANPANTQAQDALSRLRQQ